MANNCHLISLNSIQFWGRVLGKFWGKTFSQAQKQSEAEAPEDFISTDNLHIVDNVLTKLATFP